MIFKKSKIKRKRDREDMKREEDGKGGREEENERGEEIKNEKERKKRAGGNMGCINIYLSHHGTYTLSF